MCSTAPFQFRWLKGYIYSSRYYHHQIGSINLSHQPFPIIFCHALHIHSRKTRILLSPLLCSLWWVQIVNIWGCMFSVYPIPSWWLREYIAWSYYYHQIGSMNYYPLFRVRSWNNGMRCMSLYILLRRTLVGNKIVDHSDVVGASPVGAALTASSFST